MRLTGEAVNWPCVNLGSATLYDSRTLVQWFAGMGFEAQWNRETTTMGLYLIAKR